MQSNDLPEELTVDGERWQVSVRQGHHHFTWLTSIAPGYGFTSRLNDADYALSREEMERTIREFMSNVNPETGYLD